MNGCGDQQTGSAVFRDDWLWGINKLAAQSELGAAALLKAVWWDLRLASLLTHLFVCLFLCLFVSFFLCLFVSLYGYGFLSGGKIGRKILHACWPTIQTGLLPFWRTLASAESRGGIILRIVVQLTADCLWA